MPNRAFLENTLNQFLSGLTVDGNVPATTKILVTQTWYEFLPAVTLQNLINENVLSNLRGTPLFSSEIGNCHDYSHAAKSYIDTERRKYCYAELGAGRNPELIPFAFGQIMSSYHVVNIYLHELSPGVSRVGLVDVFNKLPLRDFDPRTIPGDIAKTDILNFLNGSSTNSNFQVVAVLI